MTDSELEQVMKEAGVGSRTAKKLRDAHKRMSAAPATEDTPRPTGHGAPAPNRTQVPVM